jgi:hypothetical protein
MTADELLPSFIWPWRPSPRSAAAGRTGGSAWRVALTA